MLSKTWNLSTTIAAIALASVPAVASAQWHPLDDQIVPWYMYIGSTPYTGCQGPQVTVLSAIHYKSWTRWENNTPGTMPTTWPWPYIFYNFQQDFVIRNWGKPTGVGFYGTMYVYLKNNVYGPTSVPPLVGGTPQSSLAMDYNTPEFEMTFNRCGGTPPAEE